MHFLPQKRLSKYQGNLEGHFLQESMRPSKKTSSHQQLEQKPKEPKRRGLLEKQQQELAEGVVVVLQQQATFRQCYPNSRQGLHHQQKPSAFRY